MKILVTGCAGYIGGTFAPDDLARSYADPSKANAELNWEARYNLESMCKDAWEAIKNGVN